MRQALVLADDAASPAWRGAATLEIAGITADSRRVADGYLFAAIPGGRADGRTFIAEAVARGAAAVLAPEGTVWPPGVPPIPLLQDREPRRRLAQLAAGLAGSQPRIVVAVTGTNGKTSTVEFLRQIWSASGVTAASLGTLGLIAPGFEPGPGLTTPDPVALADSLAQLARAGVQHAAMEASSHGLDQFRLDGVATGSRRVYQSDARSPGLSSDQSPHIAPPSCGCLPNCCRKSLFPTRLANSDMDAVTLAALTDVCATAAAAANSNSWRKPVTLRSV